MLALLSFRLSHPFLFPLATFIFSFCPASEFLRSFRSPCFLPCVCFGRPNPQTFRRPLICSNMAQTWLNSQSLLPSFTASLPFFCLTPTSVIPVFFFRLPPPPPPPPPPRSPPVPPNSLEGLQRTRRSSQFFFFFFLGGRQSIRPTLETSLLRKIN